MHNCLSLDEIFDSLDVIFDDKSGEARSFAMEVINNYLDEFKRFQLQKQNSMKTMPNFLKKFLDDSC
jgi:hypothetical protein